MQGDQPWAKEKCSGTVDNLLIDRIVLQDAQRGRRNLSMAWVDLAKAYDSVDHHWLIDMFNLHRFPLWCSEVMQKLSTSWSTRIMAKTENDLETSDTIQFKKGLPQGEALCPLFFTLCLNPIAWKLRAAEGYKLTKTISQKVTHLLYVDDLKVYAPSENNLQRMMENVKDGMECLGLKWNEKKCAVMHVKRGSLVFDGESMKIDGLRPINFLRADSHYNSFGVRESVRQEDGLVLELAAKEFLKRVSVISPSPLYDHAKTVASNLYTLPVLTYQMWTQTWPLAELQQIEEDTRKIISGSGDNHPKGSIAALYLTRNNGRRGLK